MLADFESIDNQLANLQLLDPALTNREFANRARPHGHFPHRNPKECIFARPTTTISADLQTKITPCQFGGEPDCSQCGCMASMGLAWIGHYRVAGPLTAGHLFYTSDRIGASLRSLGNWFSHPEQETRLFTILEQ